MNEWRQYYRLYVRGGWTPLEAALMASNVLGPKEEAADLGALWEDPGNYEPTGKGNSPDPEARTALAGGWDEFWEMRARLRRERGLDV